MTFSEKDMEDWAEVYLGSYIHPAATCIGRQVRLPSGKRLDLLFHVHIGGASEYVVVELKAVTPTANDLTQLIGYMDELQAGARNIGHVRGILAGPDTDRELELVVGRLNGVHLMALLPCLDFAVTGRIWDTPEMEHQSVWLYGTPERAMREVFRARDGTEDHMRFRESEEQVAQLLESLTPAHPDDATGTEG